MFLKMGANIVIVCLVFIHAASSNHTSSTPSSASSSTPSSTTKKQEFLSPKPHSSYEVTENVVDIPDDRTLTPALPNFSIFKPVNVANTSVNINKVIKNDDDENNHVKKTSFTYVHFVKDSEKNGEGGFKKLFKGFKDYVYNLKKGVVDGLHRYFHSDDKKKEKEDGFHDKFHGNNIEIKHKDKEVDFYDKFHRSYDVEENFDNYKFDEFKQEFED